MSNIETDCGRTGCSGWPPLPNATTEVYRVRGLEPEEQGCAPAGESSL